MLLVKKGLTVEWCSAADDIDQQLWTRCFPPPLEGQWWYKTLENSDLAAQFKFFYALIYLDGVPSGIAPLFLMDVPLELMAPDGIASAFSIMARVSASLACQKTLFVGSPCAEEGTVGLVAGVTLAQIAYDLQEHLDDFAKQLGAHMVVWKDFRDKDGPALEKLSKEKKLFKVSSFPSAIISTSAGDVEGYLRTLQSPRRYKLKKKLQKSDQMGRLEVSVIQNPDRSQLSEILSLFTQTYERGKTKFERLGKEFFHQVARQEVAWFVLLRTAEEGRLVAFSLNFHLGDRVINKFIGLDYSMDKNWFLYFRLWAASTDWALRKGAVEVQSGQTGYSAKLEVGNELVPLTNYCKHLHPLAHRIFATLAKTVSWSTLDDDLKTYLKAHPEMSTRSELSTVGPPPLPIRPGGLPGRRSQHRVVRRLTDRHGFIR